MDVYKRQYNCRGCGMKHGKPTGRGCKNVRNGEGNSAVQGKRAVTNIMVEQAANTQTLQEVENTDNLHMTTARVGAQEIQADGSIQNNDCSEYVRKSDLDSFMEEMKSMFSQTQERLLKIESKEKEVDLPAAECNIEDAMHSQESGNKLHGKDSTTDSADVQAEVVFKAGEVERTVKTVENSQKTCASGDKQNSGCSSVNATTNQEVQNDLATLMSELRALIGAAKDDRSSALASTVGAQRVGTEALASPGLLGSMEESTLASTEVAAKAHRMDFQHVEEQLNNNAASGVPMACATDKQSVNNDNIKDNAFVMKQAVKRLAELGIQEVMEDDPVMHSSNSSKGRRSGAVSKSTDKIVKFTDWPHYHISRGLNLTASSYEELSLGEFCLGFVRMVMEDESAFDLRTMFELLGDILEDSVDFTWLNAKAFFKSIARDVEKGRLNWSDKDIIQKRRFTISRVFKPNNNNFKYPADTNSNFVKQMPSGGSCCALFQTNECDKKFDHGAYLHSCAYCWKHKNMLYKHSESQCFSKAKEPKN